MKLRGEVCRVIREHKPDVVFTNDPWGHYQVHPDHRVAGWSGLDGVIAARDHLFFPEQLRGGKLKHHRVSRVLLFGTREPNIWFDISGTMHKKIAALEAHDSQVGGRDIGQRMTAWAKTIGATWNVPHAEAFRYLELA